MQNLITSSYEHKLAHAYHTIDKRGLLIDTQKKEKVKVAINDELEQHCKFLSNVWGITVYIGAENKPQSGDSLNLNTPQKVLAHLKSVGYDVPKVRKKDEETSEYEYVDSADKLAMQKVLADPARWPNQYAGEPIRHLLDAKSCITFKNRYINAKLYKSVYYSNYNVAATLTGRRGSKKNIFGLGGNAQNFPSRGRLADLWKECIIARPGRIFFFVDQISAEDWPVQALSENHQALNEMRRGVNRHYNFASQIFNIPVQLLKDQRSNKAGLYTKAIQDEAEMKYYFGKKGRHANNYGMQPQRLSESLAAEGFTVPVSECKNILNIIDRIDPNVRKIFHNYIKECLSRSDHKLCTPLGRERQFLGLRSGEKNYNIYNEANSYIPQSLIGDNTGLAVLYLCGINDYVLQDGHDSICQELSDREEELYKTLLDTQTAFKRSITFHNRITIDIPIEGAIGYDWQNKVKLEEYSEDGLREAYKILKEKYGLRSVPTTSIGISDISEQAFA